MAVGQRSGGHRRDHRRRPGIGARAVRANLQHAVRIHPGNGSTANADRIDRDHRQHHRQPVDIHAHRKLRLAVEGTAMSLLVPPMSRLTIRATPASAAMLLAAITAVAGPESSELESEPWQQLHAETRP
jgi:hypothetical protein